MMRQYTRLGVYALAMYRDNVILIRKSRGPYTGRWDLPGGGVEFGESPLDALVREVQEETGLSFADPVLLDVASLRVSYVAADGVEEDLHQIGILYRVTVESVDGLRMDSHGQDSLGSRLVPLGEAAELELTPFARAAIRHALLQGC